MELLTGYSHPAKMWLAPSAERDSKSPGEQGDQPDLEARSLRVLIVEDEFFISLHTEQLLQVLGHVVVGIAVSADQAIHFAEQKVQMWCSWIFDSMDRAMASRLRTRSASASESAVYS